MPKLKNHSGTKKRFKLTASGLVRAQAAGKRHGMRKRPQKMKRNARGMMTLSKQDGIIITKNFIRVP
ncbi:MAG: 50S ribosomal protein L35 [Azospirillaceae bacterium]|jgi:large subunit ribosomal protein L35|uniref:Large ribosomal subunit protein bL35 n=4 Tax=Nitrospirillum TaxID=1543705 RepID=A0A248JNG9_9PROT|nr:MULTISPECIES: 50S ribosomal protein L35 [Azospirillaceae]MDE1148676.1 50S ribosomal protein L35 [Azospirillaceae bacterium]MEE3625840.1 50S ribosomal protein L35 [Nitrospirillum sp. BR 11752]ASG19774.1 50S ribosomal protein L35 [Nitrospirillum amazonense CBAmc]EGY02319.1 ribosomal protein L35 [Nitrospirillum amazonense Y2]MBB6254056.1 large subunit ribosomal protein L35 [Nitrospirillum iridis]